MPGVGWEAGLPAVSLDGKLVAVAVSVSDGARAAPNLALVIYDVARDRETERIVVVDANGPEGASRRGPEARAADALAKHTWRRMRQLDVAAADAKGRATLAQGEGVRVTYREPLLTVRERASGGRELFRRAMRSFSKPAGPRCRGCGDCPAPLAGLSGAHLDRASGVLLLEVSYSGGTDVCWEPDETFHVVRLGRMEPLPASAYRSKSPL
jgi:hypothetical protein